MYAIKRSDGLFLCDGAVYMLKDTPQPVWQTFDGTRHVYIEKNLSLITVRCDRIARIYSTHNALTVYELTVKDLEYLTFRALGGH